MESYVLAVLEENVQNVGMIYGNIVYAVVGASKTI